MSSKLLLLMNEGAQGGAFLPTDIDGLLAWYDAQDDATITKTGTSVSGWADKSGNGNDLTVIGSNVTYDDDGVNGMPSILMTSDRGMKALGAISSLSGNDTPYTIFVLGSTNGTSGTVALANFQNGISVVASHELNHSTRTHTINRAGQTQTGAASYSTTPFIFGFTLDGITATEWKNGVEGTSGTVNASSITINDLYINTDSQSNVYQICRYSEYIIYEGALTDEQMTQVFNYLNGIYGIY